jgi:hypothetical protein
VRLFAAVAVAAVGRALTMVLLVVVEVLVVVVGVIRIVSTPLLQFQAVMEGLFPLILYRE